MMTYATTCDPVPVCVPCQPFSCTGIRGLQEFQMSTYPPLWPHVLLSREIDNCQRLRQLPLVVRVPVSGPEKLESLVFVWPPLAVVDPYWMVRALPFRGHSPPWQDLGTYVLAVPDTGNGLPSPTCYSEHRIAEYLPTLALPSPVYYSLWWALPIRSRPFLDDSYPFVRRPE